MNFLILGNGAEELAWARTITHRADHQIGAAYPGFAEFANVPRPRDLDDALAQTGIEAVIVGGDFKEFRAEALRRVAAVGLPAICLHPPGPDSEAYYLVALSREETGAALVPDLPGRLHPGVAALRQALNAGALGAFRVLRLEASADVSAADLARDAFPRVVDVVRSVLGDIEDLTATGDPPGDRPTEGLVVQLRGPQSRRAEVRLWAGAGDLEPVRISAVGSEGSLTLEHAPDFQGPSRLIHRPSSGGEHVTQLEPWDAHAALLDVLAATIARRGIRPNLVDGTRATELGEAAARSLRRGRTIDLHYEDVSEAGTFKSVMTSLGCSILLAILVALPLALIGPALGFPWSIYIAYAIPPALVLFIALQSLRLLAREKGSPQRHKEHKD